MKYVSQHDFYEIRLASLITNLDKDSLLELYQPIIGAQATILFLTLLKQKRNADGGTIFKMEQLLKTMQLTSEQLLDARQFLEAVGLIRTYESVADDVRCYIYVIYAPKNPKAFFDDVLFKGLLIQYIGEKEAKRLANKYKVNLTIPEDYKEVSASFVDVYKLDYDDPSFKKDFGNNIIGRDNGRANIEFNYDLFFKYVQENSSLDASSFRKKEMKEIERLSALFGLSEKQMAEIVVNEYDENNSNHFDFEKVKNSAEKQIRFIPVANTENSKVSGDSMLSKKIQMMDEVAPTKFLQYLQQGTKPARSDINIVNSLSKDYGFKNGIINVIVEYVLFKNNNVLSKNYCEKIASSFAREKVITTVDAMNYIKKLSVKGISKKKEKEQIISVNEFSNDKEDNISIDEMNELLDEMEAKKNGRK